jgi:hypothetical protein
MAEGRGQNHTFTTSSRPSIGRIKKGHTRALDPLCSVSLQVDARQRRILYILITKQLEVFVPSLWDRILIPFTPPPPTSHWLTPDTFSAISLWDWRIWNTAQTCSVNTRHKRLILKILWSFYGNIQGVYWFKCPPPLQSWGRNSFIIRTA